MMRIVMFGLTGVLAGCAQSPWQDQSQPLAELLSQQQATLLELERNPQALQEAPRDVVRANESLLRASQLAGHIGSETEARHFAYLSQRYHDIALSKAELAALVRQQDHLERERGQLHVSLRAARLSSWQSDALDAALTARMQALGAEQTERGWLLTLDVRNLDEHGRLQRSTERSLQQLAKFLQLNPQRRLRIAGHSDNQGLSETQRLKANRYARQVADWLLAEGLDSSRLQVLSYAGDKPRVENRSAAGRQLNQRVELLLSDAHGQLPAR